MNLHFSAGSQQGTDPLPVEAGIHNSEELNRIFLKKKKCCSLKTWKGWATKEHSYREQLYFWYLMVLPQEARAG